MGGAAGSRARHPRRRADVREGFGAGDLSSLLRDASALKLKRGRTSRPTSATSAARASSRRSGRLRPDRSTTAGRRDPERDRDLFPRRAGIVGGKPTRDQADRSKPQGAARLLDRRRPRSQNRPARDRAQVVPDRKGEPSRLLRLRKGRRGVAARLPHQPLLTRQPLQPRPCPPAQAAASSGRDRASRSEDREGGPQRRPTASVFQARFGQAELAVARGRKSHDKRAAIAERDAERHAPAARAPAVALPSDLASEARVACIESYTMRNPAEGRKGLR